MLPKILRTGGAKVIPHGSAKAKQNKELAAAVVATRSKSGKSIGGVRKRSSGKKENIQQVEELIFSQRRTLLLV